MKTLPNGIVINMALRIPCMENILLTKQRQRLAKGTAAQIMVFGKVKRLDMLAYTHGLKHIWHDQSSAKSVTRLPLMTWQMSLAYIHGTLLTGCIYVVNAIWKAMEG